MNIAVAILSLWLPIAASICVGDGQNYPTGHRMKIPELNFCIGDEELGIGYRICDESGQWRVDDEYELCGFDEKCVEGDELEDGQVPFCRLVTCQLERSSRRYLVGDQVDMPVLNICSSDGRLGLGSKICRISGEFEDHHEFRSCAFGERCAEGNGNDRVATCEPITCEYQGNEYPVGHRLELPELNFCIGDDELGIGYRACDDSGEWRVDDEYELCGFDEKCVEGDELEDGQVPFCELVTCHLEESSRWYLVGDQLEMPELNICGADGRLGLGSKICRISGEFEVHHDFRSCASGERCAEGNQDDQVATCEPIMCEHEGSVYPVGHRLKIPELNFCIGDEELGIGYRICNEAGEWRVDDEYELCGFDEKCVEGDELEDGQVPFCRLVTCRLDGSSRWYLVGDRVDMPNLNICGSDGKLGLGSMICMISGEFEVHHDFRSCDSGERCSEGNGNDQVATCEPIICEYQGNEYPAGHRLELPGLNFCIGHDELGIGYRICNESGEWRVDDEYELCGFDEKCVEGDELEDGQVPFCRLVTCQLEGSSRWYLVGDQVDMPNLNICSSDGRLGVGSKICQISGEFEVHHEYRTCDDGESCSEGNLEGVVACTPIN